MADRVSVIITIGGDLAADQREALVHCILAEALSLEWDGPDFNASQLPVDGHLILHAYDVAWGRLTLLEPFCEAHHLPFTRWAGSCPGSFGAERLIFTGDGEPVLFAADDDDRLIVTRAEVEQLGSYEALIAYFAAGDFIVPPLNIGT